MMNQCKKKPHKFHFRLNGIACEDKVKKFRGTKAGDKIKFDLLIPMTENLPLESHIFNIMCVNCIPMGVSSIEEVSCNCDEKPDLWLEAGA